MAKKNSKNQVAINLDHITKIEGHAKLSVKIDNGKVKTVNMAADVGLRDFERFIQGRHYSEAPDITARICGICSQAHTLASLMAVEKAMKVKVTPQTKTLRHLIALASFVQSHILHMYFLALPEYLGFDHAVEMASKHMTEVKRALRLKRLANEIVEAIGGREIHCFTTVVGGFAQLLSDAKVSELLKKVKERKSDAMMAARLFGKIKYPDFERKTQYVSLRMKERFNLLEGSLVSNTGMSTRQENYKKFLDEKINTYSSAKELRLKGKSYMVGALARINNNLGILSRNAKKAIKESRYSFPSDNPYLINFAQAVEVVHIMDCLIELLSTLKVKDEKPVKVKPKKGRGVGIIEVPRGILVHDYDIDAKGFLRKANIIAPTTMNLHNIEDDIFKLLPILLEKKTKEKDLILEFEKLIRAYDPCVSCSTHFLELEWL